MSKYRRLNKLMSQKNTDMCSNKNALDYFFKSALQLSCLCVTIGVHVNKHCVSIYRQGLLRKAFDEEQQSDPPAFMLGCRREQHTEGLE